MQYAEDKTGFVSAEFVDVNYELGEAMTMEEIEKKEAEEKREKLKQQLTAMQANGDEVTLLAALIQAEAGNQPYEGQVAVGAVVMNRVRSGRYSSILAAIYGAGSVWRGQQRKHRKILKQSEGQLSSGGAGSYQRLHHGGKLYAFQERGFSGQRRSYCDRKSRILLKNKKNQAGLARETAAAPFRILNNNFSCAKGETIV